MTATTKLRFTAHRIQTLNRKLTVHGLLETSLDSAGLLVRVNCQISITLNQLNKNNPPIVVQAVTLVSCRSLSVSHSGPFKTLLKLGL